MKKIFKFSFLFLFFCSGMLVFTQARASVLPDKFILPVADATKIVDFAIESQQKMAVVRTLDEIQVWDISQQKLVKTFPHQHSAWLNEYNYTAKIDSSGQYLIETFYDAPNITVTSLVTGEKLFEQSFDKKTDHRGPVSLSASGDQLLTFDPSSGYMDIINTKNWQIQTRDFIGLDLVYSSYFAYFFFVDQNTLLIEHADDTVRDCRLMTYDISQKKLTTLWDHQSCMGGMIQVSPMHYLAVTSQVAFAYNVSSFDLSSEKITKIYENSFYPPESETPLGASIDTIDYDSANNYLLVGNVSFPQQLPKGLRLMNLNDMTKTSAFGSDSLEPKLYTNGSDHYLSGVSSSANASESGIRFVKIR